MPVAALVVGIVGLLLALVPCLGMYALPLTLLAVVFGAVGMKKPAGKGMAIAGLVCGIVGTAIAAWWLYAYLTLKNAAEDELDKQGKAAIEKLVKEAADEMAKPDPADDEPAGDEPADDEPAGDEPAGDEPAGE
jgi:hypothetical protein